MKIVATTDTKDWDKAAELLKAVVKRLKAINAELWLEELISSERLRKDYHLDQLYFFEFESEIVGLVFLMDDDPFFWPEIKPGTSLFFHKLAIHPDLCGKGLGLKALELIHKRARQLGYEWLRLDCDDRPALHKYYQSFGFSLVDVKPVKEYMVARYQLLTNGFNPVSGLPD